jgi:Tol biopolymer transport system component
LRLLGTTKYVWLILLIAALLAGAAIAFLLWSSHHSSALAFRVVPLTSETGQQDQAAFSPDGSRVAFVWTRSGDRSRNIFIKQIGSETVFRLTDGNEMDYSPAWSPDGTQIAYRAVSDHGFGIFVVSSLGGPAQKLYSLSGLVHLEQGGLSWSPDGKRLIFADGFSANSPSSIYDLSLETMQAHAITTPPRVWDGDLSPVFSPDGRRIAFLRGIEGWVRDIYLMPAAGGEPTKITSDERIIDSLVWAPDNNSIIFSSDRGGKFALWRVSVRGGAPERLPVGDGDAYQPAVSGATHHLLYTESSATWSIVSVPLKANGQAGKPIAVVSSTQQDSAPSFAPDGSRFAFQSWRTGTQNLWISSRDGLNLRELTSSGLALTGSPAFSPDGQQVAFDGRPDGHSHIFVVPSAGGSPRQITSGNSNDILPRWSSDGQFLYFASNRNGSWQSWKVAVRGEQLQQVTSNGGYLAMESPDRRWIYYTKSDAPGIWRIPFGGGPEMRILSQPGTGYWGYWNVASRGIYLLDDQQPAPRIMLYDPVGGKITPVITLDQHPPPYAGISVNRNETELLITDERNAGSHITLIENFPK